VRSIFFSQVRWPQIVLGVSWGIIVCLYLIALANARPVQFQSVGEFKRFAAANRLFTHTGTKQNRSEKNFYVALHPLSFESLQELHTAFKRDCGFTPAWRDVVWLTRLDSKGTRIYPDTVGGKRRIWGKLLVAGDEQLMDRIECMYRGD
jgi:hypothetical protein